MGGYKVLNCSKCGKEIGPNQGFYNYPSGAKCSKCGGGGSPDPIAALEFCARVSKIELGNAPSVGYMEELILEARKALGIKTKEF